MLLLTFRCGQRLYAVDTKQVVEVVPRVECRPIPHAPDFLLGLLCYRGGVVPVVDFGTLIGAGRARGALSTRVIVTVSSPPGGTPRQLALVAENVDQVLAASPDRRVMSGMGLSEAPYLGAMYQLEQGLLQVVRPENVLDARLREALYVDAPAVPA